MVMFLLIDFFLPSPFLVRQSIIVQKSPFGHSKDRTDIQRMAKTLTGQYCKPSETPCDFHPMNYFNLFIDAITSTVLLVV